MLALGVRPDTSYDEPVHRLGERAYDTADPSKEYRFVQVDSDIPADALCQVDENFVAAEVAAAEAIAGVLETAIDGSGDTKYGWLTVRGIVGGQTGLTAGESYFRAANTAALVADPSGDLGFAVSTTQVYLAG